MMRRNKFKKETNYMKKEYIMLVISIIVLIAMIGGLIYFIFFFKKINVIVPDLPENNEMSAAVIDYEKETDADKNDITYGKGTEVKLSYNVISDYYSKGIMLVNTQADLINKNLIIYNGRSSSQAFLSSVSLEGKLNWVTKVESKEYESLEMYKTLFLNGKYYMLGYGKNAANKSLVMAVVSASGELERVEKIRKDLDLQIRDCLVVSDKLVVALSDAFEQKVLVIDETGSVKNEIKFSTFETDETKTYKTCFTEGNDIRCAVSSAGKMYILTAAVDGKQFFGTEITDISNTSEVKVSGSLDGSVLYDREKIYKLDNRSRLYSMYDYNTLKLEDITKEEYAKYFDDGVNEPDLSGVSNKLRIMNSNISDNSILVYSTTQLRDLYDIYDKDLKLKKRIRLDTYKYQYIEGELIGNYYFNDKVYEVYMYGYETPSIMIRTIS